jgi:hypothetical protein
MMMKGWDFRSSHRHNYMEEGDAPGVTGKRVFHADLLGLSIPKSGFCPPWDTSSPHDLVVHFYSSFYVSF